MSESLSRDLFTSIKKIHSSALMNTEVSRKLVKKLEEEEQLDKDSVLHSIRQRTTLSTKDITDLKRRANELSWLHDNDMLARSIPDSECWK